jgi:predicted nucleotidyltransferase
MSHDLQAEVDAVMADLEERRILYPIPEDLAPAAALVRLPGGMVAEVILWLDRNPDGVQRFSDLRVVLVELVDSVLDNISSSSLEHRRAFTEDDITVLRAQPSDAAIERWLVRWMRIKPDSVVEKAQVV